MLVGRVGGAMGVVGLVASAGTLTGAAPAFADSPPYELYCPGTPIGTIALNDTKTTGTFSGSNLTNWQTNTTIPVNLVTAASAFGSTLQGSATAGVDFSGGTPATVNPPTLNFSVPIPTPPAAVTLALPTPAGTVGPAPSGTTTAAVNNNVKLTLMVSGSPLSLTCTVHANNAVPTGVVPPGTAAPPAPPSPIVIATTSATAAAAATPTTAAPAPATAPASSPSLATTGPGPGLYVLAVGGLGSVALAALLLLVGRPRRLALRQATEAGHSTRRRPDSP